MSRRYGRNQRRRARECIAELEAELAQAKVRNVALLAEKYILLNRIEKAEDFQREVAQIVGREAIIAGAPVVLDYRYNRKTDQDCIEIIPRQLFSFASRSADYAEIEAVRRETLHLLDVTAVADVMRHQMQAYVKLADGAIAYGISATALRRMTDAELRRHIVEPMAYQLALELKRRFR